MSMREGLIAVVGDKDSVLAFKALGVDVYPVDNEEEAKDRVHMLARTHSVIFVTEQVAQWAAMYLKRYSVRPYPVVVPIPSASGGAGLGLAGIKANVEKAIGADILFDKEDK